MNRLTMFLNKYWLLLGIIIAGTGLRLYKLTAISLWHDEAFSALLIKYNWGEMIYRIGLDVHPPMYYFFLRIWHYIMGDSLFSLRLLSVVFGVGTIIMGYVLIKKIFGSTMIALVTAALIAFNPFQVQYVTEARMYTMGAFFAVLAAYLLVQALTLTKNYYAVQAPAIKPPRSHMLWAYAGFTLCASILTYTHYYLLFTVAGLGLYGIIYLFANFRFQIKRYIPLALSGITIGVLFLPWLSWFLYQFRQVGEGYWIPKMNIWSIPSTLFDLIIRIAQPNKLIMVLATLVVLWIIWVVLRRYQQTEKWLILGLFLAPFLGSALFAVLAALQGKDSSVYLVRYFLFASPFLLAMIALWLDKIKIYGIKWLILFALIVLNIFSVGYFWQQLDINKTDGMAGLSALTNANVEPNHKIYVASSFEFFNFKYYNHSQVKPLLYTNGSHLEQVPHYAGKAILTEGDLVLNFTDNLVPGDNVWMVWTTAFGSNKPKVPANWIQEDESGFKEVRPYPGVWVVVTKYKID